MDAAMADKTNIKLEKNVTKENVKKHMDYEDLLLSAGEFGRYQLLLFFSMCPFYFFGVCVYFTQVFLTQTSSNHWCWIPELENLTSLERRTLAIPTDNSKYGYSRCSAYNVNWTQTLTAEIRPNNSWEVVPCQHGWEFNKTEIPYPTISSELGWVCERDSYQATAQAAFFVGSIFGGFLIGSLADRFGRIPALVTSNMIGCISGFASAFTTSFFEFTACRFFLGMSSDSCMMLAFLIVLEYVTPRYRTLVSNLSFSFFYAPSASSLPWIALACGHWKTMAMVTSLPMAISLLAPFLMPESPRWLLSRNRIDETIAKVIKVAKLNNKEVPKTTIENFRHSASTIKKEESSSMYDLLKRSLLRSNYLKVCLVYSCSTVVFDASIRNLGQLQFNFFVSFTMISCTECPAMFIAAFTLDRLGRRWLSAIVFTISCISCIAASFVGAGLPSVMCVVVARFCINIAYGASTQWAAEVLPTSVRASGCAIVHIIGNCAMILSPYIAYLEAYVSWLPLVIIGCVAALGAFTALMIPETAGRDMPQTFEDAEELVKSFKFFDAPFLNKCKKENI